MSAGPLTESALPMQYTLRQLEYFVATCEAGSVTEAALNIPVAQSSVSAGIAQLETALGVQLLIRHHAQGVSPTPAGRQFLVRARTLLRDADQLERFAAELTDQVSGPLELGCLVTLAPLVTPSLCMAFQRENPQVTIEMIETGQQDLIDALRRGAITVAVTYDLELEGDLAFEPLVELPPHALLAADHPLAGRNSLTLDEFLSAAHVLVEVQRGETPAIDRALTGLGRPRRVALTVPYHSTAVAAVPGTPLVATLPRRLLAGLADPAVRIVGAPPEIETMPYLMVWHPRLDDDPAQRWLRDLVRVVAAEG